MNRLVKATAILAASTAMVLAGCGSNADEKSEIKVKASDYNKVKYEDLKDGGTLTFALGAVPEQMNPFQANADAETTGIWRWYNAQVALYDDNAEWYPNPAYVTNYKEEVKDGKTVVTYDLNDKAVFNDGTPIDWKVWEATWKAQNGSNEEYQVSEPDGYVDIESLTRGENDFQVVVTYKSTFPWWKKTFESLLHPKVAADPKLYNEGYINNPHPEWGTGPYKLEAFDSKGGTVSVVPNEKWWGQPGKLDRVLMRALDPQAEITAFKNGELDIAAVGNKERLDQTKDMKDLARYNSTSTGETLLQINSKRPHMDDKNVRTAIFQAISRPTLLDIRFQGMGWSEPPLGSLTMKPSQKGYENNVGEYGNFDLEHAKKLLDEAGWKLEDGKTYRTKDGEELSVLIPSFSTSATLKALYDGIQSMLKNAGVKMVVDQRKPADFQRTMKDRDFDLVLSGLRQSNPFGMADVGQIYFSDSALSKTGLGSKEIDEKIRKSLDASTADEAIKLGNEAEKAALDQVGWLPLSVGPTMVATKKGLANQGAMGYTIVPKELIGWAKDAK
ncbi:hypothetical protein BK816_03195 [Boudabousia tangfeifanii]|uniref:Solute-binding protein family 5 domain-containing protein n=1 Tax=Boudabousia tangfeifanii TaxID=1912795 RepID=A0A1D9MJN2_9ACTO|nr:ABC transporter family substrate-binding protein [Boudabousia tangfeifanii]AOZ72418.1 hypothetical protein BK816_03195 [Boudabousia tangfeifanii]